MIVFRRQKKTQPQRRLGFFGIRAWRFPTFAWQIATLSSALSGFTSEFGMGSGGSRSLWSPGKLVQSRLSARLSGSGSFCLEQCPSAGSGFVLLGNLYTSRFVLSLLASVGCLITPRGQTDWVLYGQASRAISIS